MAEIIKWVLISWVALGAIVAIARVGKTTTMTPSGAATTAVINGLIIAAILTWWGN